ncbi:MAG: PAS domain-containing protein [Anaerolineaceae bacterium]|nr:PAS domain-containing protein [Anaerolineaceae bacterium]
MDKIKRKYEIRITLIYWIFSIVWIYTSDYLLGISIHDPELVTRIQNYKGWAFVTASAVLIYILVRHYLNAQRTTEKKLIENEERLRLAVESAQQGIYDLNIQSGEIVVNEIYAKTLGFDSSSFTETFQGWLSRLHPEDNDYVTTAFQNYISGVSDEYRIEFRQRKANGDWIWLLSVGSIVEYDPDGKPLRMLGTQTDITDSKAKELKISHLYESLRNANEDLSQAYDATIEGWSRAMELRDRETEGHTLRVTALTLRLASMAGLNGKDLVHIRRGALLHDMGKLGIPDSILLKPGPLDDQEWNLMRKHPIFAYEMLSPITYLQKAIDIPYCHHEKMDGSGYPRGLKEAEIPLAARIFAVVDVFDALTSNRPYRSAWTLEKTLAFISDGSDTHFDPNVVKLFFELIQSEPKWLNGKS